MGIESAWAQMGLLIIIMNVLLLTGWLTGEKTILILASTLGITTYIAFTIMSFNNLVSQFSIATYNKIIPWIVAILITLAITKSIIDYTRNKRKEKEEGKGDDENEY